MGIIYFWYSIFSLGRVVCGTNQFATQTAFNLRKLKETEYRKAL